MDSYSKYWNPWYFLFKKHCKNHGPIYFLSEDKEPDFISEVIHFKTGKGEWGERLLNSLNQIEDDLVFYMQEDFWCINDLELTDDILNLFVKFDMDHLHIKENTNASQKTHIEKNLYRLNQNSSYTQNHQFGLWKKSKLVDNVLPNENPWQNEINGSIRLNKTPHRVYLLDYKWYSSVCRKGKLKDIGKKIIEKNNLTF